MKIPRLMSATVIFLLSSQILVIAQTQPDESSSSNDQHSTKTASKLGELIPRVIEFSNNLIAVEEYFRGMQDPAEIDSKITEIEESSKNSSDELNKLKDLKAFNPNRVNALRQTINTDSKLLDIIIGSLVDEINNLGNWRGQLLNDKIKLDQWMSSMPMDQTSTKIFIKKVSDDVDEILGKVNKKLVPLIQSQERAAVLQISIISRKSELNNLVENNEELYSYPMLFSTTYFSQLRSVTWSAFLEGLYYIRWPDKQYFDQIELISLLQVLLSSLTILIIYRYRQFIAKSDRWRFLAKRPISAGIFIGLLSLMPFYRYYGLGLIPIWELVLFTTIGVTFVLIVKDQLEPSWKRLFIYGLVIIILFNEVFKVISLPIPIFRLYIVLVSLIGLLFCLRWAKGNSRSNNQTFYNLALIFLSLVFGVIILAEILGHAIVAEYIFKDFLTLLAIAISWILYTQIILGAFEWLFAYPLRVLTPTKEEVNAIIRLISVIIYFIFGLYLIVSVVMIWGVEEDFHDTLRIIFLYSINFGSVRISIGLLVTIFAIVYFTYFISFIVKSLLINAGGLNKQIERGARLSIAQLLQYIIITVGFVLLLYVLGLKLTQLTIILSALGIGIGFGLQNIVNNFISGLILLFERPIRVEDIIETQGRRAKIKHIGLRSTVILTFDEEEVIVPNSDLVSEEVTNLTLSSRMIRTKIPVGVAYGSDVNLVLETLVLCAKGHNLVAKVPEPQSVFINFGDSSLNFELWVWILDAERMLHVTSDLLQEIDRRFRKNNIEIAFPQRDLHIRSVDQSIGSLSPENKK